MSQKGTNLSGRTLEPDTLNGPDWPDIPAIVEGHCADGVVTFTKFPEGGGHIDPILYAGDVTDDGNKVSGTWSIEGDWSGTFKMQRRVVSAQNGVRATARA